MKEKMKEGGETRRAVRHVNDRCEDHIETHCLDLEEKV